MFASQVAFWKKYLHLYLYMYTSIIFNFIFTFILVFFAYGPKRRSDFAFFFFFFFALLYVGGMGECNNVVCLRCHRVTSVDTSHLTLYASPLLRWIPFTLLWIRFLWGCNTVPCRHCYPVTSVNTLHTLSCARFLRCARVFYVGETASSFVCYVANVFSTSVKTLHVTLRTVLLIRWITSCTRHHTSFVRKTSAKLTVVTCPSTFFRNFTARTPFCSLTEHVLIPGCGTEVQCSAWLGEPPQGQFAKTVRRVQRGSPKVLAHTGKCWPACNKMLPGSLCN